MSIAGSVFGAALAEMPNALACVMAANSATDAVGSSVENLTSNYQSKEKIKKAVVSSVEILSKAIQIFVISLFAALVFGHGGLILPIGGLLLLPAILKKHNFKNETFNKFLNFADKFIMTAAKVVNIGLAGIGILGGLANPICGIISGVSFLAQGYALANSYKNYQTNSIAEKDKKGSEKGLSKRLSDIEKIPVGRAVEFGDIPVGVPVGSAKTE
jgi:hypothetical protein